MGLQKASEAEQATQWMRQKCSAGLLQLFAKLQVISNWHALSLEVNE